MTDFPRVTRIRVPGVQGPRGIQGIQGVQGTPGVVTPSLQTLHDETLEARDDTIDLKADVTTLSGQITIDAEQVAEDKISVAADKTAAALSAQQANEDRIDAEAAAGTAMAVAHPFDDTTAGIASGQTWFSTPEDPPDGGIIIWKNVAGVAVQKGTLTGSQAVRILQTMLDFIYPIVTKTTQRYLGAPSGVIVRTLYGPNRNKIWDYFKKDADGNYRLVSPETRRLDRIERAVQTKVNSSPNFIGRVGLSRNDKVIFGRGDDGLWYLGASAKKQCRVKEVDGRIMVYVEGLPLDKAFCISDYYGGTNVAPMAHGNHGASWMHYPSGGGAGVKRSVNFLKGFRPGVLAPGISKITFHGWIGQSTTNGTNSTPALTTVCPKPGYLFMHDMQPYYRYTRDAGVRLLGNGQYPDYVNYPINVARLGSIIDAVETTQPVTATTNGQGETQCLMAAYEFQKRMGNTHGVLTGTVAIGSVGYEEIKKGTVIYNNLMEASFASYIACKLEGLDFDMIVGWPHQEDSSALTFDQFYAQETEFQGDVTDDISRMTNGEVPEVMFMTDAFNRDGNSTKHFIYQCLAQDAFAVDNHGANAAPDTCKAVCGTPSYILPRTPVDLIHYSNVGGAREGSFLGRAAANRKLGRDGMGLRITNVTWLGGELHCTLHLPYDVGTLTDVSTIITVALSQNGFRLFRNSDDTEHALSGVFIVGSPTNKIVAVPSPGYTIGAEYELSWALRGPPGNLDGPTAGARCTFNDGSADLDYYGGSMANHLMPGRMNVFLT